MGPTPHRPALFSFVRPACKGQGGLQVSLHPHFLPLIGCSTSPDPPHRFTPSFSPPPPRLAPPYPVGDCSFFFRFLPSSPIWAEPPTIGYLPSRACQCPGNWGPPGPPSLRRRGQLHSLSPPFFAFIPPSQSPFSFLPSLPSSGFSASQRIFQVGASRLSEFFLPSPPPSLPDLVVQALSSPTSSPSQDNSFPPLHFPFPFWAV